MSLFTAKLQRKSVTEPPSITLTSPSPVRSNSHSAESGEFVFSFADDAFERAYIEGEVEKEEEKDDGDYVFLTLKPPPRIELEDSDSFGDGK